MEGGGGGIERRRAGGAFRPRGRAVAGVERADVGGLDDVRGGGLGRIGAVGVVTDLDPEGGGGEDAFVLGGELYGDEFLGGRVGEGLAGRFLVVNKQSADGLLTM